MLHVGTHKIPSISYATLVYYVTTNMLNGTKKFTRISKLCVETWMLKRHIILYIKLLMHWHFIISAH